MSIPTDKLLLPRSSNTNCQNTNCNVTHPLSSFWISRNFNNTTKILCNTCSNEIDSNRYCKTCSEIYVSCKANNWAICTKCSKGVHFGCNNIKCDDYITSSFLCIECRATKELEDKNPNKSPAARDRVCGNIVCHKPNSSRWVRRVYQGKLQWLCSACGACLDSGKCCQYCYQIYRQGDADNFDGKEWIGCDNCSRWVHAHCDLTMGNSNVGACYDDPTHNVYQCPSCRNKGHVMPSFLPDGKTHKARHHSSKNNPDKSPNSPSSGGGDAIKRGRKKKLLESDDPNNPSGIKRAPTLPHRYMYGRLDDKIDPSTSDNQLKRKRKMTSKKEENSRRSDTNFLDKDFKYFEDYNSDNNGSEYGDKHHKFHDSSPYILSSMARSSYPLPIHGSMLASHRSPLQTMMMIATSQPEALSLNEKPINASSILELYNLFPEINQIDRAEDDKYIAIFDSPGSAVIHEQEVQGGNKYITWRSTMIKGDSKLLYWLRCCRSRCKKWRRLSSNVKLDDVLIKYNANWCCENASWDPEHSSCLHEESQLGIDERVCELCYIDDELHENRARNYFSAARSALFSSIGLPLPATCMHRPFAIDSDDDTHVYSPLSCPSNNEVDLYLLYKIVIRLGGFNSLSSSQSWLYVFAMLPISACISQLNAPVYNWLQQVYYHTIYPIELHYFHGVSLNDLRSRLKQLEPAAVNVSNAPTPISTRGNPSFPLSPFTFASPALGANFAGSVSAGGLSTFSPFGGYHGLSPSLAAVLNRSPSQRGCTECGQSISIAGSSSSSKAILCCAYCSNAVHPNCYTNKQSGLTSELMALPSGVWVCNRCVSANKLESKVVPLKSLRGTMSATVSPSASPRLIAASTMSTMPLLSIPPPLSETSPKKSYSSTNGIPSPASSALDLMKSNRKMSLTGKSGSESAVNISSTNFLTSAPNTPSSVASFPALNQIISNSANELASRGPSPYIYSKYNAFPSPYNRSLPFGSSKPPSPLVSSLLPKNNGIPGFNPSPRLTSQNYSPAFLPSTSSLQIPPMTSCDSSSLSISSLFGRSASITSAQQGDKNKSNTGTNILSVLHDNLGTR